MSKAAQPDVTVYSSVTEENGVEAGAGVSIWTGTTSGSTLPDLALMTGGIVLLMTGGSLQLV
jgi:hypothetical protein